MTDESQKPVTQAYRDNWEQIWGKKEPCPKCEQDARGQGGEVKHHTCDKKGDS